jgi:hypothetical protein
MYLDGRDLMRTFHNLIIQHAAVVILTRVEEVEIFAAFFSETHKQIIDVSYDTENKVFRS